ncbi:MAG: hypothetical protein R2762_02495 [Bryobacteraceae bacterium]
MPPLLDGGAFDFDGALKELFERDSPSLLTTLTNGISVSEFLNVELPMVQTRRADLVMRLADGTIAHVEFQSGNDRDIGYRQGIYCLMLGQRYRCDVHQSLLYVGRGKMRMPERIRVGRTTVEYQVLDIRSLDSEALLRGGSSGDIPLAILAGGGEKRLAGIVERAARLKGGARERALAQLLVLSGLRGLPREVEWEMKRMGVVIDVTKNPVLMRYLSEATARGIAEGRAEGRAEGKAEGRAEGKAEGKAEVVRELLEARFGPLPQWAESRVAGTGVAQLDRWARRLLTASSLEQAIGRR